MPRISHAEEARILLTSRDQHGPYEITVSKAALERGIVSRCCVCGGPFADGSGCEFCPKVQS